jgi:hypothetical protein
VVDNSTAYLDFIGKYGSLEGKNIRQLFTVSTISAGAVGVNVASLTVTRRLKKVGGVYVVQSLSAYADSTGDWMFEGTLLPGWGNERLRLTTSGVTTANITNVRYDVLGAVLDLEPEGITDGKWYDQSPNNLDGTVSGALATNHTHSQGVYTPSIISRSNLDADPSSFSARWVRDYNEVRVFFLCNVDPTASGGCSFSMSLPIAPYVNFTDSSIDCIGAINDSASKNGFCRAYNSGSVNGATFGFSNTGTTIVTVYGWFSYRLKP